MQTNYFLTIINMLKLVLICFISHGVNGVREEGTLLLNGVNYTCFEKELFKILNIHNLSGTWVVNKVVG